ncbi:PKD domain-containing protein [uncultured Prevotella sp.]|uniref:InlB B-repeat-containing protein n=1 Tax=uncultured Prevotella sp. TaxID=159272 RepID=UPI00258F9966|nr:PKD domain-containing protein [uncultured Prevotella sp.]
MIKSRYILTLLAMLLSMVARGQDFNPDSPPEPGARYKLTLKAQPAEAATVSGGGLYVVNANVNVKAVARSANWLFKNWTDADGKVVSTSSSFTHRKLNSNETLTANYEYQKTSLLTIAYDPSSIKTSEVKEYAVGVTYSYTASTYSDYTFVNWTTSDGTVISTERTVRYTVTENDETITAHYRFTPGSPAEPNETKPKHKVYFKCDPAGLTGFYQSNGFSVSEGNTFRVEVYSVSDYEFKGWTREGSSEIIGQYRTFSGTMGKEDVHLVAHFEFKPSSPSEPSTDTKQRHSLYATTTSMYRGETTLLPIYMQNTGNVKTLSFKLHLPKNLTVDVANIQKTLRTDAYTVQAVQEDSVLSVSLEGGTLIVEHDGVVVRIPVIAQDALKDSVYTVKFSDIAGTTTADAAINFTNRSGRLVVSTPEEGDLQARFSVETYMNRAQFANLSSENAKTFEWNFGDGTTSTERNPMHSYAEAGTYTVRLTARGIVKTVTAEQQIIINPANTWSASGDYRLDPTVNSARAFKSMHEMLELLSQCKPEGTINVKTGGKEAFEANLQTADSLTLLSTLTEKLGTTGVVMAFKNEAQKPVTLQFNTAANSADMQKVTDFFRHITLENVVVTLNGAAINIGEIGRYSEQTICSGTSTQPEAFAAISSSEAVKVSWTASVAEGCTVRGYQFTGTGNLPAMTLTNEGSKTDLVTYHVNVELNGIVIYTYIYKVYVKPLLKSLTLSSPSDKATLEYGQVTLSCSNLGQAAVGYTFHYRRTDAEAESAEEWKEVKTTSPSTAFVPVEGASYEWYATAHGECSETVDSEHRTFSIRKRSDLTVESVTAPVEVKANTTFQITAVVRNISKGATRSSAWTDALYEKRPDGAVRVGTQAHYGVLQPDASYTVTFIITSPDATQSEVSYFVETDIYREETESDESNNIKSTDPIALINRYIDAADYEALKVLYQATNGGAWTNKTWRIGSNAVTSTGWPGVTFDEEGHVLAIELQNNNLTGNLPTEGMEMKSLRTLNLSHNNLKGDVAAFCKLLPALETLNLGYNLFTELTGVLPAHITSLNLQNQREGYSLSTFTQQEWAMGDKLADIQLGSLIAYDHQNQNFEAHPTLRIYTTDNNSYVGEMIYSDGAYRYSLSGTYNYASGTEFCIRSSGGVAQNNRLRAKLTWTKGDVNADASVDVLDAQQTLNYIMGTQNGNFNYPAADTYQGGGINVQDVVATINIFIGSNDNADRKSLMAAQRRWTESMGEGASTHNVLSVEDGALWLDASDQVAALDITLAGVRANDVKLAMSKQRYQLVTHNTANGVRVVIISTTGDIISGRTKLLRLAKPTRVEQAMAADIDAQPVGVAFDGQTTDIDAITTDADSRDAVYSIDGRKLNGVAGEGIYIVNGKKKAINRHQLK